MVDLVKIRKKAKKKEEVEPSSGGQAPSPVPDPVPAPIEDEDRRGRLSSTENKLEKFKEEAGRRRESAETAAAGTTNTQQLEVLTFVIAGENYAVDIERIVEIVTPRPVTRVPNADRSIVGIISLRGTIVTLLDVRARLRHTRADDTPDTRIIVVDLLGEPVGFEVDRVLRVIKLEAGTVEPHPVVHASELDESIRGVFHHAGALTILLDFDKLLGLVHA